MNKITLLLLIPLFGMAQSKVSNTVTVQNLSSTIMLNNDTQVVTLTMVGPADRWIATQFGQFSGGMQPGTDVVYYNGSTLVDATHVGIGSAPSPDSQNWTITQNTVNSGMRTLVATRPFTSPDNTDYQFNYSDPTIGIAIAVHQSPSFSLSYHGNDNRIVNTAVPFTTLGVEDISLQGAAIYPNPSNGNFSISAKVPIQEVSVFTLTGSFVKKITTGNDTTTTVNLEGLATGVYLIELKNESQKVWKKIIVE